MFNLFESTTIGQWAILIVFLASLLTACLLIYWHEQEHRRLKEITQNLVARAERLGPQYRYNSRHGVVAICSEADFQDAFNLYVENATGNGYPRTSDKVMVKVPKTFCFYDTLEVQTLMHVDQTQTLQNFMEDQFRCILRSDGISPSDMKLVRGILVQKDPRLFVPCLWEVDRRGG